jgi:putative flippase GtrA
LNKFYKSNFSLSLLRYICIGLLAATIEFLTFVYLSTFYNFIVANTFGYLCGMLLSFSLNLTLNFGVKNKKIIRLGKFFIVNMFGLFFSNVFIFIGSYYIKNLEVLKIISIPLVVSLQFIANYFWTFKKYI